MHVMKYAGTLGMAALHKKWANTVGTALMVTLATIAMGVGFASGGFAPLIVAGVVGLSAATGSVMVAAAAVPANKGLNIASAIAGGINMALSIVSAVASVAAAANALYAGLTSTMNLAGETATGFGGAIQATAVAIEDSAEVPAEVGSTAARVSGATATVEAQRAAPVINITTERLRALFPTQVEGKGDAAVFKIRSLRGIAHVMTKMQMNFDLDSSSGDRLLMIIITAQREKQGVNLNKFCAFLNATRRVPSVAKQVDSLYSSIMRNTSVCYDCYAEVVKTGNGVFFIYWDYVPVPIRIYVVQSQRGEWSAVVSAGTMQNSLQFNV